MARSARPHRFAFCRTCNARERPIIAGRCDVCGQSAAAPDDAVKVGVVVLVGQETADLLVESSALYRDITRRAAAEVAEVVFGAGG
jgi:hypothetical protein